MAPPPAAPDPRRAAALRRARTWLAVGSTLATLLAAECGLRVAGYGDRRRAELDLRDGLPWPPALDHGWSLNAAGFRDRPWQVPAPAGTYRVVVLGDSFVEGVGVRDDETLPAALEHELRARWRDVEVLNLGLAGTNTQQQAALAQRWLPVLRPDLVLLAVVSNDAETMPWTPDPVETCGVAVSAAERVDHFLLRHVYLYRPLHAALGGDACQGPQRCTMIGDFSADVVQARCFRRSLAAAARAATGVGATFLGTYYIAPMPYWTHGAPNEPITPELQSVFASLGLSFFDLRDAFADLPGPPLWLPRANHPSALAHRLVARALATEIERRWATGGVRVPVARSSEPLTRSPEP